MNEWIERGIRNPAAKIVQADGRIRLWGKISAMDNRFLRCILCGVGETVHNVFFERRFKIDES